MASDIPMPDMFIAGDIVEIEYRLRGQGGGAVNMAIQAVKEAVWRDQRLDYQGSRIEQRTDLGDGQVYQYLMITVAVRRTLKADRGQPQRAGMGAVIAIAAAAVATMATAAVVAYQLDFVGVRRSAHATRSDEAIAQVLTDPTVPDDVKARALDTMGGQGGSGTLGKIAMMVGAGVLVYMLTK